MRPTSSAIPVRALMALALWAGPGPATAQLIGLQTVPLAAGEQFLIFPSSNLGMAGVSIALDDALSDPFANPATGARATESRVFSVPTFYSVSNENGGARTMPVGVHLRGDLWFGGGVVALQDLVEGRALRNFVLARDPAAGAVTLPRADALSSRSSTNRFAQLSLGRRLGARWAVAASAMFSGLNGTDGVEQLFANAWAIDEVGSARDFRIGLTGDLPGQRTVEVALVRNRFEMTHDVTTVTWALTDSTQWRFTPAVAQESHSSVSDTWGAHVRYAQPLSDTGWRAGGILTVNRKSHPHIPTYDLTAVNLPERPPIPRDPGNSWAFDIGAGLAYEEGPTTFAIDVVHEPATSDTWADDVVDVTAADGSVIPAGDHTVDNHFSFANARAGVGLGQRLGERWALQLGVRMRSYSYRMEQQDHVTGVDRKLTQQWTEWAPTWGVSLDLNGLELRYTGLASSASHFPFPDFGGVTVVDDVQVPGPGDVLAAPAGRLGTPDETVVTHRLQVSVPIR